MQEISPFEIFFLKGNIFFSSFETEHFTVSNQDIEPFVFNHCPIIL